MNDLKKLIDDQEMIIRVLMDRGDKVSQYVARRAMDGAVLLMMMEEKERKINETN